MDKKKALRFSAGMDIRLLNCVLEERPFAGGSWEAVAANMQQSGVTCTSRRCRERTSTIVDHFRKDDRDNLRKYVLENFFLN